MSRNGRGGVLETEFRIALLGVYLVIEERALQYYIGAGQEEKAEASKNTIDHINRELEFL